MEAPRPTDDTPVERIPKADSYLDLDEAWMNTDAKMREATRNPALSAIENQEIWDAWWMTAQPGLDELLPMGVWRDDPDRVIEFVHRLKNRPE